MDKSKHSLSIRTMLARPCILGLGGKKHTRNEVRSGNPEARSEPERGGDVWWGTELQNLTRRSACWMLNQQAVRVEFKP